MKVLIVAEHDNQTLNEVSFHAISAAQSVGQTIDLIVMGHQCQSVVKQAQTLPLQKILVADNAVYEHQLAENCAAVVAESGKNYDYIFAAASTFGKNILPRVAALLDVAMLSDVTQILAENKFVRPIYAGNVMATVELDEKIKVMTIRTTTFPAVAAANSGDVKIESLAAVIPNPQAQFEKQTLTKSERPALTSARVVVSGGRALKSAENFKLIEELADVLGGAVGASRAAVDAGFVPNDYQVGQTGKVVAPDLYIAVGISGAIQHLAGMKDSKVIVAINNDPDAPIFQNADYVMVGDLFKILPELKTALQKN